MLDAIHESLLREHGGLPGVRDAALAEAALARPRHKWTYVTGADLALLAAAYAYGLSKNHPFVDGNKRAAFMAAYVFLGLNKHDLDATEVDVVATMEQVADGRLSEAGLAAWMRARLKRTKA